MAHELRGSGETRLRFDRTQVVLDTKTQRTVIPLDQIMHVERGKQMGSPLFLGGGALLVILGVLLYFVAPASIVPWIAYPVAGLLFGGALIALYFTQTAYVVRIGSARGTMALQIAKDQLRDAAIFIRDLMATRTAFLEGVYEAE